jgi:pyruvate ferredoxin oxidoreductase delta subunit
MKGAAVERQSDRPRWTDLPLGVAILTPGSAREYHTGSWRSAHPAWRATACVSCGVCTLFCPEGCLSIGFGQSVPTAGLDYCKGCGICAHECPTGCISMVDEEE